MNKRMLTLQCYDLQQGKEFWMLDNSFQVVYHIEEKTWSNPDMENFSRESVQALNGHRDYYIRNRMTFDKL